MNIEYIFLHRYYEAFVDFHLAFSSYPSYTHNTVINVFDMSYHTRRGKYSDFRKYSAEIVNFISFQFTMIHRQAQVY